MLGLAVLSLIVLPFVDGYFARLAQAVLTGLIPAALIALAAPARARPGVVLATALSLGLLLSGSLVALVALHASGPIETSGEAALAPAVMLVGLVLLPLLVVGWGYSASAVASAGGEDGS